VSERVLVSLDGGGVVADVPLVAESEGAPRRLRVHVSGDPAEDLTVWVEGGWLRVAGQYGTVHWEREAPNVGWVRSLLPPSFPRARVDGELLP
jgi:hypothetical protein